MNEMQKKTDIKNIKVAKTSKGKLMILAGCVVFDSKEFTYDIYIRNLRMIHAEHLLKIKKE